MLKNYTAAGEEKIYDAAMQSSPSLVDVDVFHTPVASVNWNEIQAQACIMRGYIGNNSTNALNDEIEFDVVLGVGMWTLELMYLSSAGAGIITMYLDGMVVGAIDCYSAASVFNNTAHAPGIIVTTAGKKRLKLKMISKNASSTSYGGYVQHIQFRKTSEPALVPDEQELLRTYRGGRRGVGDLAVFADRWLVQIVPFMTPISHTGWANAVDAAQPFNAYKTPSGTQNDEIEFDVMLQAGTWEIKVLGMTSSAAGIITCYLDGVSVGTMDQYAAGATVYNVIRTISGIVIATSGKKRLKLKMATKNAGSSGYAAYLSLLSMRRTA